MRALVAAGLAVFLVVTAAAPHVHTGPHGADDCAVCVVRHADAARTATPDVAPVVVVVAAPERAPVLPHLGGAPLGAVPGQSPPIAA
ncbi:hypothetical protein [Anaeromyxobacter oryzae]|uniref:Uncharacterized protein n=1 Tax=Anaeromyxobacter oryzae TaxID=2918170 RepID=A0ABM7WQ16_9BACT|nr:hypothetical protein [Anaeromyxobacter oryzae]BDG01562.1 hypothetical protein AMOR_05580 [Anaeromyxobacter oryzae]